jgi:hypothetical protein
MISQGEQSDQNGQWELQSSLSSDTGLCEDRTAVIHNFQMVENAAKLLGIAPEVSSSIGFFSSLSLVFEEVEINPLCSMLIHYLLKA